MSTTTASSHTALNCRFCKKTMRTDTYLRHVKSAHAQQIAEKMTEEEKRSAIRNCCPVVVATVAQRKNGVPVRDPVLCVCAVCGKGRHSQYDDKRCLDVENFLATHDCCRDKFSTVAYLFSDHISKPKAKPRGKAGAYQIGRAHV